MKKNDKINFIINILKECDSVVGIGIVGSYFRKANPGDIDFLIVTTNNGKVKKYIKQKLKNYKLYSNDDSIRVRDFMNLEIGLALYNLNKINSQVNDYLSGKNIDPIYKNWNIVGWLPESFLFDLNSIEILYDKYFYLKDIRKKIKKYPLKLKQAIIESCNIKIENLKNRINKAKTIESQIIESEIISLNIRKKFAEKEIYFSGFKSIDDKIIESEIHIND